MISCIFCYRRYCMMWRHLAPPHLWVSWDIVRLLTIEKTRKHDTMYCYKTDIGHNSQLFWYGYLSVNTKWVAFWRDLIQRNIKKMFRCSHLLSSALRSENFPLEIYFLYGVKLWNLTKIRITPTRLSTLPKSVTIFFCMCFHKKWNYIIFFSSPLC
jgi:hypothetical protein